MKTDCPFAALMDLLFPPRCALCGKVAAPGTLICGDCARECTCAEAERRISLGENGNTISCRVPYRYEGKVRDAIIRFKFHGQTRSAAFFGRQIAALFQDAPVFDLVTAVPISAKRRKARGYNQSELVARQAAARLSLPYAETLEKTRDNREQHRLAKPERRQNVKNVYAPVAGAVPNGARVLLVDDIVTTGATLAECARTLYAVGAGSVFCAAIAEVAP